MVVDLRSAADGTAVQLPKGSRDILLGEIYAQIARLEKAIGPVGTAPQPETIRPL